MGTIHRSAVDAPVAPQPPAWHKNRYASRLKLLVLVVLLGILAMELACRYGLGLGDPPLSITDPEIEYLFRPDAAYRRFGNRIYYNVFSMRSDAFPAVKTDPAELRVLLIGDSVINGGALTDQVDLATERLQFQLKTHVNRPVVVGNISAGSWGPANQAAYLQKFGLFDADLLVLVLSSHDYADYPTFEPTVGVHPAFPDTTPFLALQEAVTRYLPPYLPDFLTAGGPTFSDPAMRSETELAQDVRRTDEALAQIVEMTRKASVPMLVAIHASRDEQSLGREAGFEHLLAAFDGLNVDVVDLQPAFKAAMDRGEQPYRDPIHPSAAGQAVLADALLLPIMEALEVR